MVSDIWTGVEVKSSLILPSSDNSAKMIVSDGTMISWIDTEAAQSEFLAVENPCEEDFFQLAATTTPLLKLFAVCGRELFTVERDGDFQMKLKSLENRINFEKKVKHAHIIHFN